MPKYLTMSVACINLILVLQLDSIFSFDSPCLVKVHIFQIPCSQFIMRALCPKCTETSSEDITQVILQDLETFSRATEDIIQQFSEAW